MHVLAVNEWTQTWARLGQALPRPKEILCISAHWTTIGTGVTAMPRPATIHDFGNFPRALHEMQYPAEGSPELAARIARLLAPMAVTQDHSWGLDHGCWSVLSKAYPHADVPVVQLSIDATEPPAFHFDLGARLMALRDEGVLIVGSGNVVHNLMLHRRNEDMAYDWAVSFNDRVRSCLLDGDYQRLIEYSDLTESAALSVPTPEHFLPLLYVAGAAGSSRARMACDGVTAGAMSMMSVVFDH